MLRRFINLLLAAVVTVAALTACPRTGFCCLAKQSAAHDCCHKAGAMIRTSDCCRGSQQLNLRAVNSHSETDGFASIVLIAGTVVGKLNLAGTPPRHASFDLTRGPAPPGTLTAQHTSLLL